MASQILKTANTTTNAYKPALQLQTTQASTKDFHSSLPGAFTETSEQRYWAQSFGLGKYDHKKYAHPRRAFLQGPSASIVHQIVFGPPLFSEKTQPLLVVGGPRITLHGIQPQSSLHRALTRHLIPDKVPIIEPDRQIPTGGHLATAAAVRNDGRLVAVGTDAGLVRLSDTTSRATLATFPASLPIRSIHWFRDGQRFLSTGDDAVVRVWALGGIESLQKAKLEMRGHGDVIRCAELYESKEMVRAVTGSYDHTIRVWNLDNDSEQEEDRCMSVLHHGAPVECLKLLESDNRDVPVWLVSVGGTLIKVWNIVTGECVCELQAKHRKTITSFLAIEKILGDGKRVLRLWTAGLDSLIRVHSWDARTGQIRHLHGIVWSKAITALAVNEKNDRIAIGCIDGSVDVRQKGPSIVTKKRSREPKAGTFAYFTRGQNANPSSTDYVVEAAGKKRKLAKYDQALKEFRYGDSLDEALDTRNPRIVVAVLEELGKRRGLTIALSNRDEETLEPILSFLVKYIAYPRFSPLLIGVANKAIDIYGSNAGESETIDELFVKLKKQVHNEGMAQRVLLRVSGQLDLLIARASDENNS